MFAVIFQRTTMILRIFYPNFETSKDIIISSSIAGGLLYLLLIIYQPFGTSQFEHPNKYLLLFPYAIIGTVSFFGINFLLTKNKRKWTLGLELFKIFFILLLISTLSYFYNSLFLSKVSLSFNNFLYMFVYTLALGLPISALYIMARYIYMNKKNESAVISNISNNGLIIDTLRAADLKDSITRLHIIADYGNFHLDIEQEDFVYAEAADNYCIIYFYKNGTLQKEIIRISLSKLLSQIQTDDIKRVHRSFIVNLKKVMKYKGNTSGYKIWLENPEKELMVSRNFIDSIIPVLKNIVVRP